MFIEMIKYLLTGISIGFVAFLKVLPLYEQLNGIKEQLIAIALGIPVVIVSIIFLIPTVIRIAKKVLF